MSLHIIPKVHRFFNLHKFEWIVHSVGFYSEDMLREFYNSFVPTLKGYIDRWAKLAKQVQLTSILLWGYLVDIFGATIYCFL